MTKFAIITDVQLAEGITASIIFPSIIYFMERYKKYKMYISTMIAWFVTWIFRKFTVNTYTAYKQFINKPIYTYHINLPISFTTFT